MTTVYAAYLHDCINRINAAWGQTSGRRYTQRQLAEDAGVTQSTASRILSGESREPNRKTFDALVVAAHARLREACPGEAVPPPPASTVYEELSTALSAVTYEIDAARLERALSLLTEDVPEWCKLPTANIARLIMRYYEAVI